MESKTDIGKAFRDRLDQLNKQPSDSVWDSITGDLDKGKAKGFPSWMKLSVIAATFLIVGFLTYPAWQNHVPHIYMKMPDQNKNVNTSSPGGIVAKDRNNDKQNQSPDTFNAVKGTNNRDNNTIDNSAYSNETTSTDELAGQEATGIKNTTTSRKNKVTINADHLHGSPQNLPTTNSSGTSSPTESTKSGGTSNMEKTPAGQRNQANNDGTGTSVKATTNTTDTGARKDTDAKNTDNTLPPSVKTVDTQTDPIYRNYRNNTSSAIPKDSTKVKEDESVKKDSVTAAPDKGAKKQDPIVNSNGAKRFSIYAFISPTEYGTTENGEHIDATLAAKQVSSKTSLAYGGYLGYKISENTSLRVGMKYNKIQLSTNDIYMSEGNAPLYYTGIEYDTGITNDMVRQQLGQEVDDNGNILALVNLRHHFDFLEVPVEISYRIIGDKFGISIIGGASARYITTNTIYASNEVGKITLGKYSNADEVSIGGALGAQLSYEFVPNLQVNVEPMLRYNFKDDGLLQPLAYSVQAGLQYNFDLLKGS